MNVMKEQSSNENADCRIVWLHDRRPFKRYRGEKRMKIPLTALFTVAEELADSAKNGMPKLRQGEKINRETTFDGEIYQARYDFKKKKPPYSGILHQINYLHNLGEIINFWGKWLPTTLQSVPFNSRLNSSGGFDFQYLKA